jgi:integrase/recombinase XerD
MSTEALLWSETKQQDLQEQLSGFWLQDEWNMDECPLTVKKPKKTPDPKRFFRRKIRLQCTSSALTLEIKYACWQKFARGEWLPQAEMYAYHLPRLIEWLNHVAPSGSSLLQSSLEKWEMSLRSYLAENGRWTTSKQSYLDASLQQRIYTQEDHIASILRQIYQVLEEAYDNRPEFERDVWDLRKFGIHLNHSGSNYTMNFASLSLPWLRQAAKCCMRYELSFHAASACTGRLCAIKAFSRFLSEMHPTTRASDINRSMMIEYMAFLATSDLKETTRAGYLIGLRIFFEWCTRENWAPVFDGRLIYDDDLPGRNKVQPRFIPQEVVVQLNQHLEALPDAMMRMVLILQECGMRISELCQMPIDCLMQDASGDWFLRYYQAKMHKEHSIPLAREIVAVIQEQQVVTRQQWGTSMNYLFPNEDGTPTQRQTFVRALNRLAYEKKICDATGKPYHLQSHQFRHTVGTRMINNGVPQHIVQRYLGHESPTMTARYAFIYDQTMKEEYAKFRGKIVDVTGKVIEQKGPVNSGEAQWIKKNILAQALPNGQCALPLVGGDCPHANACLTCVHFRTNASFLAQHQAQLQETQRLIQVARANGWQRQVEMNERVETNLNRMISTLQGTEQDG